MQAKAVIFDMDGLMIDSERVTFEGYVELCAREGKTVNREMYVKCLGKNVPGIHQVFYDAFGEDFPIPRIMKENHIRMNEQFETKGVPVKEGLRELLQWLREQDIPAVVATSSSRERVDHILELAGLSEYFKDSVCGDEVEHGKPAPDIFLEACKRAGVKPEEALVLEDSESGIEAAFRGGIPVICVVDMKEPEPAYAAKVRAKVDSLNDVLAMAEADAL